MIVIIKIDLNPVFYFMSNVEGKLFVFVLLFGLLFAYVSVVHTFFMLHLSDSSLDYNLLYNII